MKDKQSDNDKDVVRTAFENSGGNWSEEWAAVLHRDQRLVEACTGLFASSVKGGKLDGRTRELINVAVNVACTHLDEEGTRAHIRRAFIEGVSADEIAEAIQLASVLGIHSCSVGLPILVSLSSGAGEDDDVSEEKFDQKQRELKDNFVAKRGYWTPLWNALLVRSPEFFAAYTHYSSLPWEHGRLSPKTRELIYVAIDISTNHLFVPGTEIHIANALKHGATPNEILEVIEVVSLVGLKSLPLGYRILQEELAWHSVNNLL